MHFAINHNVAPKQSLGEFFGMAKALGLSEVEIRNDISGAPIQDGTLPEAVKAAAEKAGVRIITINALYPFNVWSPALERKANDLADYAAACGAQALVMCPLNEGASVEFDDLVAALRAIKPILEARSLTGFVEPLGFSISSLRTKAEAVRAIDAASGGETYKLVHDTFHHRVAGEQQFFPGRTGLVHISGVTDPRLAFEHMLDAHRVLVDAEDRLGNVEQIKRLTAEGYAGPFSFEPFSPKVQGLADPGTALRESMSFIRQRA